MTFASLGLADSLLRAVAAQNYTQPTPIQAEAIPAILDGRDVLAAAQTGTGKTAAFTLPLLQRLMGSAPRRAGAIRALVLTPTRELAAQVEDSIRTYGAHLPLRAAVVFGGVGIQPQIERLRRGVDILVATPGRLLDLQEQGVLNLAAVEILVLDEADRMLDMGFIPAIRRVLALLPKQRQNLLFSATFSPAIRELARGLLASPKEITVTPKRVAADTVEQGVYLVGQEDKAALLSHLVRDGCWHQVLVFTRTKHGANRLTQRLQRDGIEAVAIHGNKSQNARTRALDDFKRNRVQAMVATDIAARGLDIDELPRVVNFELPNVAEDYVHRIGRTGRAGASGIAVSLVAPAETDLLRGIERLLGRSLPRLALPPDIDIVAAPRVAPAAERSERAPRPAAPAATPATARGAARSGEREAPRRRRRKRRGGGQAGPRPENRGNASR